MSAPSSAHILASFTFVTPQILICFGVIIKITNRRAFGRACPSVTAVLRYWMPLGRAARECRTYLSSAQVLQSSHHSSLVWIVICSVELGCCDEIAQGRFGVGRAHQRFTYGEAAEAKRLKMTQRFRTFQSTL